MNLKYIKFILLFFPLLFILPASKVSALTEEEYIEKGFTVLNYQEDIGINGFFNNLDDIDIDYDQFTFMQHGGTMYMYKGELNTNTIGDYVYFYSFRPDISRFTSSSPFAYFPRFINDDYTSNKYYFAYCFNVNQPTEVYANYSITSSSSIVDQIVNGTYTFVKSNWTFVNSYRFYVPHFDPIYHPLYGVDITHDDLPEFKEWLLQHDRTEIFKDFFYNYNDNKLQYLLEWWDQYGGDLPHILIGLPNLFLHFSDVGVTTNTVRSCVNTLNNLYLEYENEKRQNLLDNTYLVGQSSGLLPHHRRIDTDIDDDSDPVLHDQEDEPLYITLLRNIYLCLVQLPEDLINITSTDYNTTVLKSCINAVNNNITNISDSINNLGDSIQYTFVPTFNSFNEFNTNVDNTFNFVNNIPDLDSDLFPGYDPDDEIDDHLFRINLSGVSTESDDDILNDGIDSLKNLDFYLLDLSKVKDFLNLFKAFISVVAIFKFVEWLINNVPSIINGESGGES